jgi:uncharacterized short protein YbdD (DUF466 family)
MDKDEAKAILIANLKGSKSKRTPLLTIAEAVRLLINDKEYGSSSKVAESFGVKRQTIEAFEKMNDQPEEMKKMIQEGQILIDASTKLSSILDPQKRVKFAKVVAGLSAFDTRYVVDYYKKHPDLSPEECKKAVFDSKTVTNDIHLIVVPLDADQFDRFRSVSKRMGLKLEQAAKIALKEWVQNQGSE